MVWIGRDLKAHLIPSPCQVLALTYHYQLYTNYFPSQKYACRLMLSLPISLNKVFSPIPDLYTSPQRE